jgi:hypothetical protein
MLPALVFVKEKGQKKLAHRPYQKRDASEKRNGHCGRFEAHGSSNRERLGQGHHDTAQHAVRKAEDERLPEERRADVNAAESLLCRFGVCHGDVFNIR